MIDIEKFVKERDEALLSLDKEKILKYCRKYKLKMPSNDKAFWAGIHKARLQITDFPESEKELSRKWLLDNNFSLDMN